MSPYLYICLYFFLFFFRENGITACSYNWKPFDNSVGILNLAMIRFHKTAHRCFLKDANKMVSLSFMFNVFMSALTHLAASPNLMPRSDFTVIGRSLFFFPFFLSVCPHSLSGKCALLLADPISLSPGGAIKQTLSTEDNDVYKQADLIANTQFA